MKIFDSETCGLVGPMVTLQYVSVPDDTSVEELANIPHSAINLYHIWDNPIATTLELIADFVSDNVVGFNLMYDWFHLTKIYNLLHEMATKQSAFKKPDIELAIKLEKSNPSKFCLRPRSAFDIMLHAQKGRYQACMKRKNIVIRRIPNLIAHQLSKSLKEMIPLDDLYFQSKPYEWKIVDSKDKSGKVSPDFVNLELEFSPRTTLRVIAAHALNLNKADWPIPKDIIPTELSYKPYGQHGEKPWGTVIEQHIAMWKKEKPTFYAKQDVVLTAGLYSYFSKLDNIVFDDVDSFLAVMLGGTRLNGFAIDKSNVPGLIQRYSEIRKSAPRSPNGAKGYLHSLASPIERQLITSTAKPVLESLAKWSREDSGTHPVADAANKILAARRADKRIDLLTKINALDSFHPEFKIIGAKSARLSGGSDDKSNESLNPNGIPRDADFRSIFTIANPPYIFSGGDADSYEVNIMAATFKDKNLTEEMKQGKKFHALVWSDLFHLTYDEALDKSNKKSYDSMKTGTFSWAYGGTDEKVASSVNKPVEEVRFTLEKVNEKYPGIKHARDEIYNDFCSMRQPGGIGTKVVWHEPKEYVESLLGFRRYFTLENSICKGLFAVSNSPPKELKERANELKTMKVFRKDREQTVMGAVQSAIYAAAFNIQASNLRQAGNHKIQSTGAQITKAFQAELYQEQPIGIHEFMIKVMNQHDELLVASLPHIDTFAIKDRVITKYRSVVPTLKWEWKIMKTWADK